jgi:hypothetical protein
MLRGHLQFTIGEFWWTAHPWMAVVDEVRLTHATPTPVKPSDTLCV